VRSRWVAGSLVSIIVSVCLTDKKDWDKSYVVVLCFVNTVSDSNIFRRKSVFNPVTKRHPVGCARCVWDTRCVSRMTMNNIGRQYERNTAPEPLRRLPNLPGGLDTASTPSRLHTLTSKPHHSPRQPLKRRFSIFHLTHKYLPLHELFVVRSAIHSRRRSSGARINVRRRSSASSRRRARPLSS